MQDGASWKEFGVGEFLGTREEKKESDEISWIIVGFNQTSHIQLFMAWTLPGKHKLGLKTFGGGSG